MEICQRRGATIAWTYEAPEAGEYTLEIDYSLARAHAGVPIDVLINNRRQLSFETEETGEYDSYKRITLGTVKMAKGKQDLALDVTKAKEDKLYVMQLRRVYLTRK